MNKPTLSCNVVCTVCGWTGKYSEAKHLSENQLRAKGVINEKGEIIDAYILTIKRINRGYVDLTWCPNCNCFITVYYENENQNT